MTNDTSFRITPRLVVGLAILALGILWTLDSLDIMESDSIVRWWPVVVILFGAAQLYNGRTHKIIPIAVMGVGVLLLLDAAHRIDFDFGDLFPLVIVLVGGKLIWDAVSRRSAQSPEGVADADSVLHAFAIMAGVRRQSISSQFRGGDASAIMGGVELDLRNAQIREGDDVVIDAFVMWGGVEIKVPQHWRIVGSVLPIMGAYEDNTHPTGEAGPTVTIRGTALMGGIEVKN